MSLSAFGMSVEYIVNQLIGIPGFMLFLCFRGFCEAWTALKLGDNTAYMNGYLTMNPKKHINPIGFLFLIVFGFGFSNPVPTNSRNYKNIKRDNAIQILSAPLSGLVLMFLSTFALFLFWFIGYKLNLVIYFPGAYYGFGYEILRTAAADVGTMGVLYNAFLCILAQTATVSIFLAVFFLLPLPGFDGYRLIANFLPYKYYSVLYKLEKYNFYIFIVFILLLRFIPGLYSIVAVPANAALNGANWIFTKILTLLL